MVQQQSTSTPSESRRYRIIGVLGRGGFGTVYHARMEGGEGFVKDVAIKLLTDEDPPPETLSRFRDEARILGRLRDRAIVNVDPPTKLDGRWAVVMEYVDGADCRKLLHEYGRLPPTAALGIVEEIARTLDNLWNQPGEDGAPLRLLHRDLKPSNLQVTPSGAVKILDFGVARADISHREATTTNHISGTLGYIAPERVEGVEDTRGDLYSLGVVLEELVTGRRPTRPTDDPREAKVLEAFVPEEVLRLARDLRSIDPADRPTALEVEQRCMALTRALGGPSLREWAREKVRVVHHRGDDPLIGQTLSETIARLSSYTPRRQPRRRRLAPMVLGLVGVLFGMLAVFSLAGVGMGSFLLLWKPADSGFREPVPVAIAPPSAGLPITRPPPADPVAPLPEHPEAVRPPAGRRPPPAPPASPAIPATGVVAQSGADAIELIGAAGRFGVGIVPAGDYKIMARFGTDLVPAGDLTITDGGRVELRCDGRFKRCMLR